MNANDKILKAAKLCLCWLSLLLAGIMPASSQPLSVTLHMQPNPSPYLSDWEQRSETIVLTITNTSQQVQQVYFTGTVAGDNGVSGQTKQGFKPAQPLQVPPNATTSYTGPQLKGLFVWEEIQSTGVNVANVTRSGMLPAGEYELCVTVKSFQSDVVLTSVEPSGCTPSFTIALPQPPVVTTPPCEETVSSAQGQPIIFSWMPMAGTPQRVQYRLRIVEIIGNRSANDALQSATTPPVFDKTISGNSYMLNPVQIVTPNRPGPVRFAWNVTAVDPAKKTFFSNNGESEACSFEYAKDGPGTSTAGAPDIIRVPIWVEIGKPWRKCYGFGICKIHVELPPYDKMPPAPDAPKAPDSKEVPDSRLDPKKPKVYATLQLSSDKKALTLSLSESDIKKYQPDKLEFFKGKTSVMFEEDNPIGKYLIIPAGTYPMSLSGGYYSINAAVKFGALPGLATSSFYVIGWSFGCGNCTEICKAKCVDVEIKGKNFKEKNGKSWRKMRRCVEEKCYNLWGDLCCAYLRLPEAGEDGYNGEWEVGSTDAAGGATWGPPGEAIPCTCGTLFDILQKVNADALLKGGSWQDRVDRLESRLKLYCPGLTLANLPGMAENCGFPGADKEVTGVGARDLIAWVEEFLRAFKGPK